MNRDELLHRVVSYAVPMVVEQTSRGERAYDIGAVLLGGGAKGKRAALPNARILIHQASAGVQGTAADIEVHAREILRLNARLKELMASDTGQDIERISHDINRDYWMSAPEAKD